MKNLFLTVLLGLIPFVGFMQVKVDAKDIIAKLNKGEAVVYENVTISGNLDFRLIEDKEKERDGAEVIFKENITYKYHVNAPMNFSNCTFDGEIIGYYNNDVKDELHIVMFHEDVLFNNCTFKKDFLVKYTEFFKNASFKNNVFEGDALFKYVEFNSAIDFTNSVFEEDANFKYAEFPLQANFSKSKFNE